MVIVGLGLIGGSLGMALRRQSWRVSFIDPNVSEEKASEREAADEKLERLSSEHSIVVLATPVDAAIDLLDQLPSHLLATSVCSVMRSLRAKADERSLRFMAGHPLAGSENRGLDSAREDLFSGKRWFIDEERRDESLEEMIAGTGAITTPVNAAEHDRAIALTSHLPQILSTALAAVLSEEAEDLEPYYGNGLRTFLRLAGSDFSVWESIIRENRDNIVEPLNRVSKVGQSIVDGRGEKDFAAARRLWERLTSRDS